MAKRKQLWHPNEVRQKIQTSQLINRLTQHALSDDPIMDSSQVQAARALINKVVPDVTETTFKGDPSAPLQVEVSPRDRIASRLAGLAAAGNTSADHEGSDRS
jgi:hypothetical protein